MAHYTQVQKKAVAPLVKKVLRKYGMKGTLSVRNHSTVVLNIREGEIDFGCDRDQVNVYWINQQYTGRARDFLLEVREVLMQGNHDNSDIMTDYFDVGWYVDINIGKWNRPYACTAQKVMG